MGYIKRISYFIQLFKKAVKGEEENFTEGSINRAIFLLSVPAILEMMGEAVFAVVDMIFVSRLNNSDAVAVIGLTESMLALVYSLAWGVSMGATAIVARRVGEKDTEGAAVAGRRAAVPDTDGAALLPIGGRVGPRHPRVPVGSQCGDRRDRGFISSGSRRALRIQQP